MLALAAPSPPDCGTHTGTRYEKGARTARHRACAWMQAPIGYESRVRVALPWCLAFCMGWLAVCQDLVYRNLKLEFLPGLVTRVDNILFDTTVGVLVSVVAMFLYRKMGEPVNKRLRRDEELEERIADKVGATDPKPGHQ